MLNSANTPWREWVDRDRYAAHVATNARNLYLDRLRHAYVNLDDPTDLDAVRPGSKNRVLEIDGELVKIAKRELGLVESKNLQGRRRPRAPGPQ